VIEAAPAGRCRGCGASADRVHTVIDFGSHPHASSFPTPAEIESEPTWPLAVVVCDACWLVQLAGDGPEEPAAAGDPPWTTADSLTRQATELVRTSAALARSVGEDGLIVEVASHGNHLQPLFRDIGLRSVIVERSPELAAAARASGADVIHGDLGSADDLAGLDGRVVLLVDHYALAHHPRPDAVVAGITRALAPGGRAVFEFDSILPSLERGEFDGFRHGHFGYFSLTALTGLLARHGLSPVEATTHPVYGGVLRVVARRSSDPASADDSIRSLVRAERQAGLESVSTYARFERAVRTTCHGLRRLIDQERASGGRVAAYGAASRGNTLLNACGIGRDRLAFVADRSAWKQGRLLPGSHVPIVPPAALRDGIALVLILTWDIADEVSRQLAADPGPPLRIGIPFPEVRSLDVTATRIESTS
jgi:SAM-dependent methyltransferase